MIDQLQYLCTCLVVSTNMARLDSPGMAFKRNIIVFVILAQCVKVVIDWLRLFGQTTFYVTLILKTMVDISSFLIIQGALLFYIGIAVYMLQLNNGSEADFNIVDPIFDNFMIDAVLNQYLLILG